MNTPPAVSKALIWRAGVICAALASATSPGLRAQSLAVADFLTPEAPAEESKVDVRLRLSPPPKADPPPEATPPTPPAPTTAAAQAAPAPPRETVIPVAYCFGPLFGNNEREPDPNYMPPPVATPTAGGNGAPAVPAIYTRVSQSESGLTTWVAENGSEIRYLTRTWAGENRAQGEGRRTEDGGGANALIAENRQELTKLSWERVRRRFPEIAKDDGAERQAFEAFVLERQADPRTAEMFAMPIWPESVAAAYVAAREWATAESASWARVRSQVGVFNDPESAYTRRFIQFTEALRADPQSATIFQSPDWPEKVLELHNQRLGPVPAQQP